MSQEEILRNISKSLTAILLFLIETKNTDGDKIQNKGRKIEILLAEAGFKSSEISSLIGKNPKTIQKAIQRNRKEKNGK